MNTLSVGTRTVSVRSASSLGVEVLIYLNVSWLLVNDYILRIMQYSLQSQEGWFADSGLVQDIAAGNAVEPYRTRLLVPWIVVGLNNLDDATLDLFGIAQFQRLIYVVCFALLLLSIRMMLTTFGFGKGSTRLTKSARETVPVPHLEMPAKRGSSGDG